MKLSNNRHLLIFLSLFVVNLFTPVNNNLVNCFGGIFQADYAGNFPSNVYQTWLLRGIGYKYLLYFIYKLVSVFIKSTDYNYFQVVSKLIYYSLFLGLSLQFFKLMESKIKELGIHWYDTFILFLFFIMASSWRQFMEPEEVSIFLTLGMISFSLANSKTLNYLSGVFVPLLISMKVVTILFAAYPLIILLYFLKSHKKLFARFIMSCLVFSGLTAVIYLYVFPQEIIDMKYAIAHQSNFTYNFSIIIIFLRKTIESVAFVPFLIVGFGLTPIIIFYSLKVRNYKILTYLGLMQVPALLMLFSQLSFRHYHYLILIPYSYILLLFAHHILFPDKKRIVVKSLIVASIIVWTFSIILPTYKIPVLRSVFANPNPIYYKQHFHNIRENVYIDVNDRFNLSEQEEILFLSDGIANFYIRSKSYLRHFAPHSLQIGKKSKDYFNTDLFRETLAKTLDYTGEYILLNPNWFKLDTIMKLNNKINNEYYEVYDYENNSFSAASVKIFKRRNI